MRDNWKRAYRLARIIYQSKPSNTRALCSLEGVDYLAWFTVQFKRGELIQTTPARRLFEKKVANKIIDEILAEEKR